MKSLVYKTTIQSPEDLVTKIVAAAGEIAEDQAMIRKTVTEKAVIIIIKNNSLLVKSFYILTIVLHSYNNKNINNLTKGRG